MSEYFNLITTADFCYVNRIREITPQKGQPYWCATLACLEGKAEQPGKVYIDVILPDSFAFRLATFAGTQTTVKASVVRIGYRDPRLYEKDGETRVCLKGVFAGAHRIWTEQAVVYQKPRDGETEVAATDVDAFVTAVATDPDTSAPAATTALHAAPTPQQVQERLRKGLVMRNGQWVRDDGRAA